MSPPITHPKKPAHSDIRWQAALHPHRSSDRVPVLLIVALLGGSCFVAGVAFSAMGAWPVFGFLGLDLLLLYVAFKMNRRAADAREVLTLTKETLHIERYDPWGRRQEWSVPAPWLRVVVNDADKARQPHLELHNHGRIWTIAKFLYPEDKLRLAHEIREALSVNGPPPGDQRSFDD